MHALQYSRKNVLLKGEFTEKMIEILMYLGLSENEISKEDLLSIEKINHDHVPIFFEWFTSTICNSNCLSSEALKTMSKIQNVSSESVDSELDKCLGPIEERKCFVSDENIKSQEKTVAELRKAINDVNRMNQHLKHEVSESNAVINKLSHNLKELKGLNERKKLSYRLQVSNFKRVTQKSKSLCETFLPSNKKNGFKRFGYNMNPEYVKNDSDIWNEIRIFSKNFEISLKKEAFEHQFLKTTYDSLSMKLLTAEMDKFNLKVQKQKLQCVNKELQDILDKKISIFSFEENGREMDEQIPENLVCDNIKSLVLSEMADILDNWWVVREQELSADMVFILDVLKAVYQWANVNRLMVASILREEIIYRIVIQLLQDGRNSITAFNEKFPFSVFEDISSVKEWNKSVMDYWKVLKLPPKECLYLENVLDALKNFVFNLNNVEKEFAQFIYKHHSIIINSLLELKKFKETTIKNINDCDLKKRLMDSKKDLMVLVSVIQKYEAKKQEEIKDPFKKTLYEVVPLCLLNPYLFLNVTEKLEKELELLSEEFHAFKIKNNILLK